MQRKTILFFTTRLGGGGAEMHLLRLLNTIDRERFEPHVAVVRGQGSYENELRTDVPVHVLTRGISSSSLGQVFSIWPLRRLILKLRPELVCSVMTKANMVMMLANLGLNPRPIVVGCVQNNIEVQFKQSRNPADWWVLPAVRHLYPRFDHIIITATGLISSLGRIVQNESLPISAIPNACLEIAAVEQASQTPLPAALSIQRPLIVACGRLTEQKGFAYLLNAIARVKSSISEIQLWLLGEGKLQAELESQVKSLNLQDNVSFLGFQPNVFRFMAAADIFVLSSLFEGFGNVVVEAMAAGAPVISTDCPFGPGEIITSGVNGLLVPTKDEQALATAILELLNAPAQRQKLSDAGRHRALDFGVATITARYQALFEQLLVARNE
ncbi:MAG: glycosyltransferase [Cyanobacteria bacterium P01_H01_bin.15]